LIIKRKDIANKANLEALERILKWHEERIARTVVVGLGFCVTGGASHAGTERGNRVTFQGAVCSAPST